MEAGDDDVRREVGGEPTGRRARSPAPAVSASAARSPIRKIVEESTRSSFTFGSFLARGESSP
jgi:hypothetical protein